MSKPTYPFSKRFSLVDVGAALPAGRSPCRDGGSLARLVARDLASVSVLRHPQRSAAPSIWAKKAPPCGCNSNGAMGRETRAMRRNGWSATTFRISVVACSSMSVPPTPANGTTPTISKPPWIGLGSLSTHKPAFAPQYARLRPRTRFFSLFVSDKSDAVEAFYVPTNGPLGATSDKDYAGRDEGPVEVRSVRTITLNDLLAREGITRVDFLSMDIELAEPRALAGFDIEKYRPALVCIEAHPRGATGTHRLLPPSPLRPCRQVPGRGRPEPVLHARLIGPLEAAPSTAGGPGSTRCSRPSRCRTDPGSVRDPACRRSVWCSCPRSCPRRRP